MKYLLETIDQISRRIATTAEDSLERILYLMVLNVHLDAMGLSEVETRKWSARLEAAARTGARRHLAAG